MREFNTDDKYENIEIFKKAVMKKIENTRVEHEDFYEDGLFLVNNDHTNMIINADSMAKELDVPLGDIIQTTIPNTIKKNNSKYYATVNTVNDDEGGMCLLLTVGSVNETSCYIASIYTNGEVLDIGAWESYDPTDPDIEMFTMAPRRAIVNQG